MAFFFVMLRFLCGADWYWSWFDISCVILAVFDLTLTYVSEAAGVEADAGKAESSNNGLPRLLSSALVFWVSGGPWVLGLALQDQHLLCRTHHLSENVEVGPPGSHHPTAEVQNIPGLPMPVCAE